MALYGNESIEGLRFIMALYGIELHLGIETESSRTQLRGTTFASMICRVLSPDRQTDRHGHRRSHRHRHRHRHRDRQTDNPKLKPPTQQICKE